ncbi:30387_t:CDS:2, partial [Gigaspora margarita]
SWRPEQYLCNSKINPYFIHFPIFNYIPFLNKQSFKRVVEFDNKIDKIIELKREDLVNGNIETASSLATALYLLAAHKVTREEILTVLGDDLTPSAEQHRSLKYLNMIIYVNLRLYPKCCGNVIPTGACIQIFIYGIHHSSKLWKNPEEFLPERFENESEESGSWFSFDGGSRK